MKAVLIVDMPNSNMCWQCRLLERASLNCIVKYWCGGGQFVIENPNEIPNSCPLKPLPQKRMPKENGKQGLLKLAEQFSDIGFNACLDEILGGKE